ncbi:ribulose-phosphate 3-epimerase [Nematocida sp. AWRm80]|nr:ribulose-phosphate 3-epimerase [Nematocida sp. AWRm80]
MRVSASILSCNLLEIKQEIERLVEIGIKELHIDIMDGVLVNNIFLGEEFLRRIVEEFPGLEIECHLMVSNPLNTIKNLDLSKIRMIIVHNNPYMEEISIYLKNQKAQLGIGISPMDTFEDITVPSNTSKILIMGVCPGRGGQKMLKNTPERIAEAKRRYPGLVIGVDGGINTDTISQVKQADEFVLGSCLWSGDSQATLHTIYLALDSL